MALVAALWLTACGRSLLAQGYERYAIGDRTTKAWLAIAAGGAQQLWVATDGSLIAWNLGDQGNDGFDRDDTMSEGMWAERTGLHRQNVAWIDPLTHAAIGKARGWPVSRRPWPAPYVSTQNAKRYVLHRPGQAAVTLAEPGGDWAFTGGFEVEDGVGVLVLRKVDYRDAAQATEALFVRFRFADGAILATNRFVVGRLTPQKFRAPLATLTADRRRILLAWTFDDRPAGEVIAVDTGSLAIAWRREVEAVDRRGYMPIDQPAILLANGGSQNLTTVFVGEDKYARGLQPNSLYTLDANGEIVFQHHHLVTAPEPYGTYTSIRALFVTGDTTVTVVNEVNSRDFERSSAQLVHVDMLTGAQAPRRWRPPGSVHRRARVDERLGLGRPAPGLLGRALGSRRRHARPRPGPAPAAPGQGPRSAVNHIDRHPRRC
jgi:hypothetical protein